MPKDSEFYLFSDIDKSCTEEIRGLGINANVKLVKGGIEITFLDAPPLSFAQLKHLPVQGFDFSNTQMPSSDEWTQFPLKSLVLPSGISFNFEGLYSFQLKKLIAEGVQSEDFEKLATHPLSSLSVPKSNLQQIEFLAAMNFQYLNLGGTAVDCLQPLKSSTDLKELDIFKCKINDLSPLAGSSLEKLILSGNPVHELTPVAETPLRHLEMRATKIESLDPLSNCPLEVLHLPGSPVCHIGSVVRCPIRELNIIGLTLNDFECLRDMRLESLSVSPDKLKKDQFELLQDLDLQFLIGPGDDKLQSPQAFFDKYASIF